jgi:hypothetical protein
MVWRNVTACVLITSTITALMEYFVAVTVDYFNCSNFKTSFHIVCVFVQLLSCTATNS